MTPRERAIQLLYEVNNCYPDGGSLEFDEEFTASAEQMIEDAVAREREAVARWILDSGDFGCGPIAKSILGGEHLRANGVQQ